MTEPTVEQPKAQLMGQFAQDPDMAFDDELGWLHKSVLASVNEMREELAEKEKELEVARAALVAIYGDGLPFTGAGRGYSLAVSMRNIAKHALAALRKEGEKG